MFVAAEVPKKGKCVLTGFGVSKSRVSATGASFGIGLEGSPQVFRTAPAEIIRCTKRRRFYANYMCRCWVNPREWYGIVNEAESVRQAVGKKVDITGKRLITLVGIATPIVLPGGIHTFTGIH